MFVSVKTTKLLIIRFWGIPAWLLNWHFIVIAILLCWQGCRFIRSDHGFWQVCTVGLFNFGTIGCVQWLINLMNMMVSVVAVTVTFHIGLLSVFLKVYLEVLLWLLSFILLLLLHKTFGLVHDKKWSGIGNNSRDAQIETFCHSINTNNVGLLARISCSQLLVIYLPLLQVLCVASVSTVSNHCLYLVVMTTKSRWQ